MSMTLEQVSAKLREQAEFARGIGWPMTKTQCLELADAIDAHLAQPAQSVDVRVVYELFQDGFCVAGSDDLSDALHYVSQYSQDGLVELRKVTCHSEIIDAAALQEKGNGAL